MNLSRKSIVLALLAAAAVAAAQPMSGVYPVGPGGPGVDSFASIQVAAAALSARGLGGDVSFPVAPGVYSGAVLVRNVAGSASYATLFRAETTGVMVNAGGARYAFEVDGTDNVTLRGLRFEGARGVGNACVRFVDSDSGRIARCRVGDSAASGFLAERSDWLRLDSNLVVGPMGGPESRGVDFRDCRFGHVERCSILGTVGTGLSVTGGSDFFARRISVMEPTAYGVRVEESHRGVYQRCFTRGTPDYGLHAVRSAGVLFDSCTASGPTVVAAYFEECDSLFFKIPMIVGSAEKAFWLRNSEACTVRLLSVMGQPTMGFVYDRSPGVVAESTQMMGMDSDTGYAFLIDSCPDASFTISQMVGSHRAGMMVRQSDRVRIRQARIRGIVQQAGIVIENSSGVRIDPCSLNMGAGPAGVLLTGDCADDTLSGMTILATTEQAIVAQDTGVRDLVIANNFIAGWTGDGIMLDRTRSPRLYYNTIVSRDEARVAGIRLLDVTGAEAKDNVIWNKGLDSSACVRIEGGFPFASGAIDYNDLYANGTGGNTAWVNGTLYPGLTDWRAHSSNPDPHSIARDPLFADSGDFHLGAGSPCRDSATPIPGWTTDQDGDARDPATPDIGADEYRIPAIAERPSQLGARRLEIIGNPSAGAPAIRFSLPEPTEVGISVRDVLGREVLVLVPGRMRAGNHRLVLDQVKLAPGVYLLELRAGTARQTAKIIRS